MLVLALYIKSNEVRLVYNHPELLWGICLILIYWISRIWFLARRRELSSDPVLFAIKDRHSLVLGTLMVLIVIVAARVRLGILATQITRRGDMGISRGLRRCKPARPTGVGGNEVEHGCLRAFLAVRAAKFALVRMNHNNSCRYLWNTLDVAENLIIGTGPSAVSAAMALRRLGANFETIDVGFDLEPGLESTIEAMSRLDTSDWVQENRLTLFPPPKTSSKGVEKRLAFGSDFSYRMRRN